jgi:formylglycine-generating enzyme required for sulfatase activity
LFARTPRDGVHAQVHGHPEHHRTGDAAMMRRTMLALTFAVSPACTGTVSSTIHDASVDASSDRPDRTVLSDVSDVSDVRDVADVLMGTDRVDVPVGDAGRCPPTLPDGGAPPPPPGVSRSCGPGGAPTWHCNEVAYCGGQFTMGSTDAAEVHGTGRGATYQMRECDPRVRIVRGGYIDAYEVTVARYRTWIRAGMPMPRSGEYTYPLDGWSNPGVDWMPPGYVNSGDGDTVPGSPATVQNCTWSPVDGVNDDLPINCVDGLHAAAFCQWDGRHMVSEEAWEYLASNYGTTARIRPEDLTASSSCDLGDLNSRNGICPQRTLPRPVQSFPLSGPPSVPGLFGMIGGVVEIAAGPFSPMDGICSNFDLRTCCRRRYPNTDDHTPREGGSLRGTSWWMDREDQQYLNHVSSRNHGSRTAPLDRRPPRSPNVGIRCARWVPGVW